MGRAHAWAAGRLESGQWHVAVPRRKSPTLWERLLWGSAKPLHSSAEMKGLGVAALRFLLGSHFKNLHFLTLVFVLWLWCKGAASRAPLAAVPSTLNSLKPAVAAKHCLPCSFSPCPDLKCSSGMVHLAWGLRRNLVDGKLFFQINRTNRALNYHFSNPAQ